MSGRRRSAELSDLQKPCRISNPYVNFVSRPRVRSAVRPVLRKVSTQIKLRQHAMSFSIWSVRAIGKYRIAFLFHEPAYCHLNFIATEVAKRLLRPTGLPEGPTSPIGRKSESVNIGITNYRNKFLPDPTSLSIIIVFYCCFLLPPLSVT